MTPSKENCTVALDLGGTWVKGAKCPAGVLLPEPGDLEVQRWANILSVGTLSEEYAGFLAQCCREIAGDCVIAKVVIATAGEVGPSGRDYRITASHLEILSRERWIEKLESELACSVSLINDADAMPMPSC